MALIKCPDCGREVSDRASSCPNCGCPMNSVNAGNTITQYKAKINHKEYRKKVNRWLLEAKINSQPINGNEYKQGDKVALCNEKGNELVTVEISTYFVLPELGSITFGFDDLSDEIANQTAYIVKTTNECVRKIITNINDQPICPVCGSTQIQIVRRNYSFLTGFMTNKVDRVCVNCKHKF